MFGGDSASSGLSAFASSSSNSTMPKGEIPVANVFPEHRDIARSFKFEKFNAMQKRLIPALLHSKDSIVVSAPTGAGKTAIFSLGFVSMVISIRKRISAEGSRFQSGLQKAVYIAPLKALVRERIHDWKSRYNKLGLKVLELTGDSAAEFQGSHYMREIDRADFLIATPEKLESVSRRFNAESKGLLSTISLLMVDEVHMLSDARGAVLEACISRIKRISDKPECKGMPIASLRIIAASATLSNGEDVAAWLSTPTQKCLYHQFGPEHRPCPLSLHVAGIKSFRNNDFLFDKNICKQLPPVIFKHSSGKPSLVFCATRKKAEEAARLMHTECDDGSVYGTVEGASRDQRRSSVLFPSAGRGHETRTDLTPKPGGINVQTLAHAKRLQDLSSRLENVELRRLVLSATAFHHAEMSISDRALISDAYKRGDILVLCCTSSLSMGINLPAHLVVVLNVKRYEKGGYTQYTRNELLQMIGRAGRKGFDTHGVAVIMCQDALASQMSRLNVPIAVESCLHAATVTHLNSEITLENVNSIDQAVEWMKSTFFYTRVLINPGFYKVSSYHSMVKSKKRKIAETDEQGSSCSSHSEIDSLILTKLKADLKWLSDRGLILWNSDKTFASTELGRMACRSYLSPKTAALFKSRISDRILPSGMKSILKVLSQSEEFICFSLRKSEKKHLNSISHVTGRYLEKKKTKVKTVADKIFQIFQHIFGNLRDFSDFNLRRDTQGVLDNARRISRGLTKYLSEPNVACPGARIALTLEKMLAAKMWWDDNRHATSQLPSVSKYMAESLAKNGYDSIEKIARASSVKDLARASGKRSGVHINFGNKLISEALAIPYGEILEAKFDLNADGDENLPFKSPDDIRTLSVRTNIDMRNHSTEFQATHYYLPKSNFMLIIHTEEKKGLLYYRECKIGEHITNIKMKGLRCDNKSVTASLVNGRYIGVDSSLTIKVPGPHYVSEAKAGTRILKKRPKKNSRQKSSTNGDLKSMLMSQKSSQGEQSDQILNQNRSRKVNASTKTSQSLQRIALVGKRENRFFMNSSDSPQNVDLKHGSKQGFRLASDVSSQTKDTDQDESLKYDSNDDILNVDKYLEEIETKRKARRAKNLSRLKGLDSASRRCISPKQSSQKSDSITALLDEYDNDDSELIMQSIEKCEKIMDIHQNITRKSFSPYIDSLFGEDSESTYGMEKDANVLEFIDKNDGGAHAQPGFDSSPELSAKDSVMDSQASLSPAGRARKKQNTKTRSLFNAWQYRGPENALYSSGPSQEQLDEVEAAQSAINEPTPYSEGHEPRELWGEKSGRLQRWNDDKRTNENFNKHVQQAFINGSSQALATSPTPSLIMPSVSSPPLSPLSPLSPPPPSSSSSSSNFSDTCAQSHSQQTGRQQAMQRQYNQKRFQQKEGAHFSSDLDNNRKNSRENNSIAVGISNAYRKALGSELISRPRMRSRAPVSCSGTLASLTPSPTPYSPSQETQSLSQRQNSQNYCFPKEVKAQSKEPSWQNHSHPFGLSHLQLQQQGQLQSQEYASIPVATVVRVQTASGNWISPPSNTHSGLPLLPDGHTMKSNGKVAWNGSNGYYANEHERPDRGSNGFNIKHTKNFTHSTSRYNPVYFSNSHKIGRMSNSSIHNIDKFPQLRQRQFKTMKAEQSISTYGDQTSTQHRYKSRYRDVGRLSTKEVFH